MKILLIATNRERSPMPVAPLGALMVAAAAQRAGHAVDVLDLAFKRNPVAAARKAVRKTRPELVGLSIRNLDNCFYCAPKSYTAESVVIANAVRAETDAPMVVGGCGFSVEPAGWMERLPVDYGVVGEGEKPFLALLDAVSANKTVPEIPGLIRAKNPQQALAARPDFADSFDCPAHALINYKPHLKNGGFVSIQSKRGCPYQCIYCIYPQIEGRAYRLRDPEAIADEMARVIADKEAKSFFFTDSVFNCPRDHAMQICEALRRKNIGAAWMAYCNPEGYDRELAEAMQAAGCVGVEFGLDAATNKMLGNMGKSFSQDDIARALQANHDIGLPSALHFLFGGPGETWEDIRETQDFIDQCATPEAVFASMGIRIYSGTPLEKIARDEGVLGEKANLFMPHYYVSPALGDNVMAQLDHIARRRPEWTTATDWLRRDMRLIQGLINRLGMRPQWKNIRNYGRRMRKQTRDG
ncbi:MAG: B12-binding domain-containing radical SAM protein [Candidatus Sumerlaeia bacterium]